MTKENFAKNTLAQPLANTTAPMNASSLKRALQANKVILSNKQYAYEKKYTISHGLEGPDPYSTTDFGTEEALQKMIASDRNNKHAF